MLSGFLRNLCLIHHLKLFWPHTASTVSDRKVAKRRRVLMILSKEFFFQNIKIKSSNHQIQESGRLKSEVVIFQAFKTSSAYLTSPASATSPASTALNANFLKTKSGPDGLIITGTKLTNTGHFLWNGSPKIQFFTKLWHSFWRRLLRLREVKRVSNDGSGINFHYAGSHWASLLDRFVKRSGQARSLLSVKT